MDVQNIIGQKAAAVHQNGVKQVLHRNMTPVVLVQNVGNHGGYVLRRMGNAGEILRNLWISFHHLGQIC